MHPSFDELLSICCAYAGHGYFVGDLIPANKLDHFRSELGNLSLPQGESVVALLDCTLFGSNKEGVAICTNGVYWNNNSSRPQKGRLAWEEIARGPIVRLAYTDIQIGRSKTISLTGCGFPADQLSLLLMDIQTMLVRASAGDPGLPLHDTAPPLPAGLPLKWKLAIAGTECGWYAPATIRSLISAKHLDPAETVVWKPGLADWIPLRSVPDLTGVLTTGSVYCPACSYENQATDRFCGGCGKTLGMPAPGVGSQSSVRPAPAPVAVEAEGRERLDLNSAPIDALLALPRVTLASATALVGERTARHGFSTVEEVGEFLGLQPHEMERLRDRVTFGAYSPARGSLDSTRIDLNQASEAELMRLPGLGPVFAKKAASLRATNGAYATLDDFAERVNLPPHVLERIRDVVMVSPPQPATAPPSGKRVVDY